MKQNKNLHNPPGRVTAPITRVAIDEREETAVLEVLRSGWLAQGKQVAAFEQSFAVWLGMRHAIAVSSGTTALHLALLASNVQPGDEVILPSFTFVATANAIEYVGARPIFVDIDIRSFTIDPDCLETCIQERISLGKRVAAVIPVSLFGLCAPMDRINQIAQKYDLAVIEDAACGLGGTRHAHKAGTEAGISCFSFHPRKVITTGEGGMLVTNDQHVADHLRRLRDHGAMRKAYMVDQPYLMPEFNEVGYNYRMTDLQGAIGVVQMEKLDGILAARKEKAERYRHLLGANRNFILPGQPDGYHHGWQTYATLFTAGYEIAQLASDQKLVDHVSKLRRELMQELEQSGIATRQGTHAVHTLTYYREKYGYELFEFPMCYLADRLSLALPLYDSLSDETQTDIRDRVSDILEQFSESGYLDFQTVAASK